MALLNEIIGVPARFNGLLSRKFNIAGGAPAPQLTPEIGTSLSLDFEHEDHILAAEFLCTGRGLTTGAAGQSGSIQLNNPVGSGFVCVIEQIMVMPISAPVIGIDAGILVSAAPPNVTAAGSVIIRDTRVTQNGNYPRLPSATFRTGTGTPPTATVPNLFRYIGAIGQLFVYTVPCVVSPGFALQLLQGDLAGTFNGWIAWREVPLAPGEVGPF
jgi:hypothetical protein